MPVASTVVKGKYLDSVKLMLISREIRQRKGVIDAVAIMATPENKSILKNTDMLLNEFSTASENDICIAIKAENKKLADELLEEVEQWLQKGFPASLEREKMKKKPRTLNSALKRIPKANLVLISVPGKYAAREAKKALENNLHVMLFSDNVSIHDEKALKEFALSKNLLMMGPDCGTAIINGVPLAFANAVRRGEIGIVSAAGTGLQEVSSVIHNEGQGISQAFGTGGRDGKKEIGGLMLLFCLQYLIDDPQTAVIVLICKLPDQEVIDKLWALIKKTSKDVIVHFLTDFDKPDITNLYSAPSLARTAIKACRLIDGAEDARIRTQTVPSSFVPRGKSRKYLRGIFSGGTLCYEAQTVFFRKLGIYPFSNSPVDPHKKLENSWLSRENSIIDLGADEFTVGRLHPMIDFSLRLKKIKEESHDPETAVILFDVVLGYGANPAPHIELAPVLKKVKANTDIALVCSVTGTDEDPQKRQEVIRTLEHCGTMVTHTNVEAAEIAAEIIQSMERQNVLEKF